QLFTQTDFDCVTEEPKMIVTRAALTQDPLPLAQRFEPSSSVCCRQCDCAKNHRTYEGDAGFQGYVPAPFKQFERASVVSGTQSNARDDIVEQRYEAPCPDRLYRFEALTGVLLGWQEFALVQQDPTTRTARDQFPARVADHLYQVDDRVAVIERFIESKAVHMRNRSHR